MSSETVEKEPPSSHREQDAQGKAQKMTADDQIGRLQVVVPYEQRGCRRGNQNSDQEEPDKGATVCDLGRRIHGVNSLGS